MLDKKLDKVSKKPIYVVGLMSGTSVDGIDACVVKIFPDLSHELITGDVIEFPSKIREKIFSLFEKNASVSELCKMNFLLGECFAVAAKNIIKKAGLKYQDISLIGSHGQTIMHLPDEAKINNFSQNSTLQIGEPCVIAERIGITTIADFRVRDMAACGNGAPLVCFADEIMFKKENKYRAIQNIGGISNVTVLSPHVETFAFDCGPGNVLIDYFINKFFGQSYDINGEIALKGNVDNDWLNKLLEEPYFSIPPPKTTGRELFSTSYAEEILKFAPEDPYDIVATITAFTAKSIQKSYVDFIFPRTPINELIIGGGGALNPAIIKFLNIYFERKLRIFTHDDYGISSNYKEAIAFALLAYATYFNIENNVPTCTGAKGKRVLGKIIPGNNKI